MRRTHWNPIHPVAASMSQPISAYRQTPLQLPARSRAARPFTPGVPAANRGMGGLWARLLDRLPGAVIVIDHEGAVVIQNEAAADLIAGNPGLQRRAGRLWLPGLHRYLDSQLLRVHAGIGPDAADGERGIVLRLSDDGNPGPVFIEARSLRPDPGGLPADMDPFWLLCLFSPAARSRPCPQSLQRLLGLTPAECLLVQALYAGQGMSQAAVALRISRETAKSQLASVFRKCGVRSQAQLTRLVAAGPFFSRGD